MPSDKLTFLEELSNVLAGQSATAGAKALGEGIGHVYYGGEFGEMPEVMREAVERHRAASATPKPKSKQDALELASALAAISNPVSLAGHAVDFAGAIPSMIEQKISGAELPLGEVMQSGLKRRLAKGGAQADFARANQLIRAKENIRDKGYKINPYIGKITPLESKGANWGPGEGKFQVTQDYETQGFDLNRATSGGVYGMGIEGDARIIRGSPHELGVEFTNTMGLDPRYREKGYGKQIYQNMADVYGGGISHSGSTTPEARKVYERLGAIDTGIPSGGGTRMALPTRQMKADPEALAAFEQKVKDYSEKQEETTSITPRMNTMPDDMTPAEARYYANMFNENPRTVERAQKRGYLDMMQMILQRFGVGNYALPNEFTIGGRRYRLEQNPDGTRPRYVAQD